MLRVPSVCASSTSMDKRDWGVIEARFTTADGSGSLDSPLQVGLLPKFGVAAPRAGASILALSSGVARRPRSAWLHASAERHVRCR
jgi:hypothetical protein